VVGGLSLDARLPRPSQLVAVSKDGYGLRFALAPHTEVSTRAGRRFAKVAPQDHIVGVVPCADKDKLAVVTHKTVALVCAVAEVNELAGPGRGVTVIKTADDDAVVAFICTSKKDQVLQLETSKGKTLKLSITAYETTARGGKGREMSKRDEVKTVVRAPVVVALPAVATKEGK
jgi:DNA gyrase subunit A